MAVRFPCSRFAGLARQRASSPSCAESASPAVRQSFLGISPFGGSALILWILLARPVVAALLASCRFGVAKGGCAFPCCRSAWFARQRASSPSCAESASPADRHSFLGISPCGVSALTLSLLVSASRLVLGPPGLRSSFLLPCLGPLLCFRRLWASSPPASSLLAGLVVLVLPPSSFALAAVSKTVVEPYRVQWCYNTTGVP